MYCTITRKNRSTLVDFSFSGDFSFGFKKKRMMFRVFLLILILGLFLKCKKTDDKNSNYSKGKLEGEYIEYDDNRVIVRGDYKDGLKSGLWKFYDKDGKLEKVVKYAEDTIHAILDKEDFKLQKIVLNKEKLSILLPEKWKAITKFEAPQRLIVSRKECTENQDYCPTIILKKGKLENYSFERFVEFDRSNIIKTLDTFIEVSFRDKMVSSFNSYELKYLTKIDNVTIGGIIFWYDIGDGDVIQLHTSSDGNDIVKLDLLFLEIAESLNKI